MAQIGMIMGIVGIVVAGCALLGRWMPLIPDQIVDFGVGMHSLPGEAPGAPAWFWIALTVIMAFGGALLAILVGRLAVRWLLKSDLPEAPELIAIVALAAFMLGPSAWTYTAFLDRYMIPAVPCVLILAAAAIEGVQSRQVLIASAALLSLVQGAFSVAVVHDYNAWQRTAWNEATRLHDELGVDHDRISASFEFNNWWAQQDPQVARSYARPVRIENPDWIVAFVPRDGFVTERTIPTGAWLHWSPQNIYTLRRSRAIDTTSSKQDPL